MGHCTLEREMYRSEPADVDVACDFATRRRPTRPRSRLDPQRQGDGRAPALGVHL